jgi:multiple sugar transport system permease protein
MKRTGPVRMVLHLLALALILLWTLYPLVWVLLTSFKPASAQFQPVWLHFIPTLQNYRSFFSNAEFARCFLNSFAVTSLAVLFSLSVGTPTAYALARYRMRGKSAVMIFVLLARMTPPVVLVIPFFLLARKIGISNTYLALVGMGSFLSVPFVIWMMRGFFAEIPYEIEESAVVDGCSRGQAIRRIVLPLTAPGLAATAVLCALLVWNEFFFALVLSGADTRTLPVLVNMFVSEKSVEWGTMSAAGVITVLPLVIFGLVAQKHLVRGLTMGSIK